MKKSKCLIVASINNLDLSFYKDDYLIIGVEQGCLDIIKKGLTLDVAISDFDHVTKKEENLIASKAKTFIKLSTNKMYLDGTEAIYLAKHEHHINDITFIVNPTSRTDLNLSLIEHIYKNNIKVISDDSKMFLLDKGENILSFEKYKEYNYISIFPLFKTSFIIKNLKYNTVNRIVEPFSTTTFSNAFVKNGDGVVTNSEPCIVIFNK